MSLKSFGPETVPCGVPALTTEVLETDVQQFVRFQVVVEALSELTTQNLIRCQVRLFLTMFTAVQKLSDE